MQKTPPLWQKVKEEPNSLLMKMKKESEKVDLKCSIQKTKIMASSPISSVQFSSIAQSCPNLGNPMDCSTPGFPVHHQLLGLLKLMLVMPSNHLILCCPLLLLPLIFPSIRVFFNESVLHIRWPKCWSFTFSISPYNEYSGLISFRIGLISLQSKGLSRVFSNNTVRKHQFFSAQPSFLSTSHIRT